MHLRDADLETRALENIKRRAAGVRMKIIIKSIRPQNDFASIRRDRGRMSGICSKTGNVMLPGPVLESRVGDLRHAPLRGQMQRALQNVAEARRLAKKIGDAWSNRSELRPAIDHSKRIRMQRTGSVLVIVSEEFRFISGNVHVGRAFRFAGLAGETKIERLFYVLIFPRVMDHLALEDLEEHMRAAARAVFFLKSDHIAGTHRAGIMFAAFSQSDAPQRRLRQRTAIIRKLKISLQLERFVVHAKTQVFGGQVSVDNLVRVHLIVWIPGGLEFIERLNQFG